MRWRGADDFQTRNGKTMYFSGPKETSNDGLAIILPRNLNKSVIAYSAVSDQFISQKLDTGSAN